jgi:hypothetical protein
MPISTIGSNSLNQTSDLTINGVTVGKGANSVAANTALGTGVLASGSLSGGYNTAIGFNSLAANTSGTNNTAIGNSALNANTTASDNQAFGTTALYLNTTGSLNTAVGRDALRSNTTGSYNTATGYQAGYSNAQGSANTFLGYQAGYTFAASSATSTYNTFLGYSAGYLVTTGTNNTFVGNGAGQSVTTGGKNTILGNYGGNQGGLDIRTSSSYIVLSDGDGNPKGYFGAGSGGEFTLNASASTAYNGILNFAEAGTLKTQQYYQKSVTSFYIVNSSAGVYLGAGSTAWASASDERLKDIIEPIENGLTKVASLRAVIGKFKTDAEGTRRSFLIAQDVQAVLPEAISTTMVKDDETNTEYLGVSYTDVIPLLVASIKDLKTIVDAQAAEIAELKAKVA